MDSDRVVVEVTIGYQPMKWAACAVVFYYYHLARAMLVAQQPHPPDSRVHRVLRGTKNLLAKPLIILLVSTYLASIHGV